MSDQIQIIQANVSDLVYQQDKAQIDIQINTAKAFPRNIKRAIDNSIAVATMDKDTAQSCNYSLPRSGKSITGPTVHLAKILAQNWGNLRVEAKVIDIGQRQITSQAVAFDLENNLAIKVEVKRSIMTKSGRMNDDMITVTGNAANAIALRNAVFAVIPSQVTDKVYNSAKKLITGDLSSEEKLKAKRIELFNNLRDSFNLKEPEILSAIGKASIDFVTPEDIVTLMGIVQAIKDGDTTIDQAFRGKNTKSEPVKEETTPKKSELQKFIEEEAQTLEALMAVEKSINTEEEQLAYDQKFKELNKPTTSDGALMEEERPKTNV